MFVDALLITGQNSIALSAELKRHAVPVIAVFIWLSDVVRQFCSYIRHVEKGSKVFVDNSLENSTTVCKISSQQKVNTPVHLDVRAL